jgi:F-type H+-transporting ATPase subunit h
MLVQSIRASVFHTSSFCPLLANKLQRSSIALVARQQASGVITKRTFITATAIRRGSLHSYLPFLFMNILKILSAQAQRLALLPMSLIRADIFQVDLVQELYLKELKAYKAPAIKAGDADAHVQKFAPPKAPQSPEETDIANELKAYETQAVEVEGQAEDGATADKEMDWFEEEHEEEAHH